MPASAPGETTMTPALIGLDWGTSALRAYLLAADGTVVDGRTAPLGILKVADANFEAVFEDVAGPWLGAGRYDAWRDEALVVAFLLDAFGLGAREGRATPGESAALPG